MKLTSDAQQNRILIETAFNQLFDRMTHLEGRMDRIDMLMSGEYVLMKAEDSPSKDRLNSIESNIISAQHSIRQLRGEIAVIQPLVALIEKIKDEIREEME